MIDITKIAILIVAAITTLVGTFIIPWLKVNIDAAKLEKLLAIAKIAVEAAEQIYSASGMGELKKQYVANYLAERGYKLDTNQLDVVIESAVKEMKGAFDA